MKKKIKHALDLIVLKFTFKKQSFIKYGYKQLFQSFLFQKVFRVNSHVPWPVHFTSVISNPERVVFELEVSPVGIAPNCYIQSKNGLVIGTNVIIASGVKIISANHSYNDFNLHIPCDSIRIGSNSWLGANVVVLPGVQLADHTIVAAGSVVTKSFLQGDVVIGGVPARVLKKIEGYSGKNYYV